MLDKVGDIKLELRACMNGVASAAMRSTEDYRVNFGVELPRLQELAKEVNPALAPELWKEMVRECRILAVMVQDDREFSEDMCDVWAEQIHTAEIAQIASLYLFKRLPYAIGKSLEWIASENEMKQICGFTTLMHVYRANGEMCKRTIQEIQDQAQTVMDCDNLFLKKIAQQWTSISRQKRF